MTRGKARYEFKRRQEKIQLVPVILAAVQTVVAQAPVVIALVLVRLQIVIRIQVIVIPVVAAVAAVALYSNNCHN